MEDGPRLKQRESLSQMPAENRGKVCSFLYKHRSILVYYGIHILDSTHFYT